jgi:hypothetical protein
MNGCSTQVCTLTQRWLPYISISSPPAKAASCIVPTYTGTILGATLRFSKQNDSFKNIHYLKSYQVSVDGSVSPDKHYTHTSRQPVIIGARFVKPDGSLFRGAELYVFALLVADTGRRLAVELRDDGYGSLAGFPDGGHDNKSPASPPGRLLSSRPLSPPGLPRAGPRPLVSESGVVVAAAPAGTDDGQKPNVGAYVGAPTAIARYGGPVTWYAFVFAQDVNSVPEGTDPRVAAKTIGGMLLTNNFVVGFNDKPCELNYDAAITYLGVARGGDNLR